MLRGTANEAKRRSLELEGVGLGLRFDFLAEFLEISELPCRFVEVSPENFLSRGGFYRRAMDEVARRLPVISHGLSLSLGAADEPPADYLGQLHAELQRIGARWHSDHISFSSLAGDNLHELLPLPFTTENAVRVASRLTQLQVVLGLPVSAEHVTWYAQWGPPAMDEAAFLTEIVHRSGCGLLLDVNNVYVNAENHGFDPIGFIRALPLEQVTELHVAGHARRDDGLLLDTHGAPVCPEVLELLGEVVRMVGPVPVLLERDTDMPELAELTHELQAIRRVYTTALSERRCAPRNGVRAAESGWSSAQCTALAPAAPGSDPPSTQKQLEGLLRGVLTLPGRSKTGLKRELRDSRLQARDLAWLEAQDPIRLLLYSQLAIGRIERALSAMMPMTARLVGKPFSRAARAFARRGPHRPRLLRDLALPFLEECHTRPNMMRGWPEWAHDLARHEAGVVLVAAAEDDVGQAAVEPEATRSLPLKRSTRLMHYTYPVHRYWQEQSSAFLTQKGQFDILLYRDEDDVVQSLELTSLALALMSRLRRRAPLDQAVIEACSDVNQPLDDETRDEVAELLGDYFHRGILLVGEPP